MWRPLCVGRVLPIYFGCLTDSPNPYPPVYPCLCASAACPSSLVPFSCFCSTPCQILGVGRQHERSGLLGPIQRLNAPSSLEAVQFHLGHLVHVSVATAVELYAAVKAYVDSADESAADALWPLVQRVRLQVSDFLGFRQ